MYSHLTREQRYGIYLGLQDGKSQKTIAQNIKASESTVSREISRNKNSSGHYVWTDANARASALVSRTPGNHRLAEPVRWRARELITREQWSPRQISGRLALEGVRVSHETLYKMIRSDESGELAMNCRHKMKYRHRKKTKRMTKATNIPNRTSIHERPAEADGMRFGDWEMDTIIGKNGHGAILTLVERNTNMLLMEKLKQGKKALPLAKVVWRLLLPYKGFGLLTITTDNGSEFAAHELITRMLGVRVFFADSYCSWQKGTVENTNKLIRQYIDKKECFNNITDKKIKSIQMKINSRPRQKLNFKTPKECFFKHFS